MLTRCEITKREKFEIESGIHHYNSIVIVLNGEFEYTSGSGTRRVLPMEPVFFKKGALFVKKVIKPIEFIIVSSLLFSFESDCHLDFEKEDKIRFENTVKHLIKAIKEDASNEIKEHFVNDIFLTSKKCVLNKTENTLLSAYEYISQNFSKKLSLKLLAQANCCSVQTLINRFRMYTGKTPTEYITQFRIKKAKDLLINTDFSIGQIANLCGYENVYYFSNVFKKEIGISPLKFRRDSLL